MPDDRPILYVTNWSSKKLHGPGRLFSIMARPRRWEHGEGTVIDLVPDIEDLADARSGRISMTQYRDRYEVEVAGKRSKLAPWDLSAMGDRAKFITGPGKWEFNKILILSGDTLCCACSRANAAEGKCHRVWAAHILAECGWKVILDGKELPSRE